MGSFAKINPRENFLNYSIFLLAGRHGSKVILADIAGK